MKLAVPEDPRIPVLESRLKTLQENMAKQFAEEKAPAPSVSEDVTPFLERTTPKAVVSKTETDKPEKEQIKEVEKNIADQKIIDKLNNQLNSCNSFYSYVLDMKNDNEQYNLPSGYTDAANRAIKNVTELSDELAKEQKQYPDDTRLKTIEDGLNNLKSAMNKNLQEDKAKAHLTVENSVHGEVGLSVENIQPPKKSEILEEHTWVYDSKSKSEPLKETKSAEEISNKPHIVQKGDSFTYYPSNEEVINEDNAIKKVLQMAIEKINPKSIDELQFKGDEEMQKKAKNIAPKLIEEHKAKLAAEASKPKQQPAKDMDQDMSKDAHKHKGIGGQHS